MRGEGRTADRAPGGLSEEWSLDVRYFIPIDDDDDYDDCQCQCQSVSTHIVGVKGQGGQGRQAG